MTEAEHEAMLDGEIVACVRAVARDITGGNCAFADDDVRLLGKLAALALDAGLHEQMLVGLGCYTRHNFASAIEARRAVNAEGGAVACDESAMAKPDAHNISSQDPL